MKIHYLFIVFITFLLGNSLYAQRYVNSYPNAGQTSHETKTPHSSDRDHGMVMRFGIEGGSVEMLTLNLEYEINPFFSVGLGSGGAYQNKSGWGVPIYAELRAYAPNRRHSGYVNLRLGYMIGIGSGHETQTQIILYDRTKPLIAVDKMGGFMATLGLGYSYKRFDFGFNFGLAMGNYKRYYIDDDGTEFTQWIIPHKAYLLASVQVSYSLPLYYRPYNKVVKKN